METDPPLLRASPEIFMSIRMHAVYGKIDACNVTKKNYPYHIFMPIFSFQIGSLVIAPTWYGLMYALSFIVALFLIRKQFNEKDTDTIFFFTILGVILGGRIGYVVFYNPSYYFANLLEILMPWK